jgi:hypothetical protein
MASIRERGHAGVAGVSARFGFAYGPTLVSTLRLRLRLSARSSLKAVACQHASASPRFQLVVSDHNGKLGNLPSQGSGTLSAAGTGRSGIG